MLLKSGGAALLFNDQSQIQISANSALSVIGGGGNIDLSDSSSLIAIDGATASVYGGV